MKQEKTTNTKANTLRINKPITTNMQDGSNNNYGDLPPPYKESSPGGSEGGGGGGGGDRMTNMPQPLPYLPHLAPTMPLDVKENIFRDIIMKYEIREEFANRLKSLSNFKV